LCPLARFKEEARRALAGETGKREKMMVDTLGAPSSQAKDVEISAAVYEEIASWQRIFAMRKPDVDAKDLLRNAARDLWRALEVDRTVHPESHENTRQETIDALYEMANLAGISDDDAQRIFSDSFAEQPTPQAENVYDIETGEPVDGITTSLIKPSKNFVAGFVPPDYLVDGLLQESFFYSLTGATGAGKTAITLRLAASVATGALFAGRETKKRRVLYLAAENPLDVRMRWIALSQHMNFDHDSIEVFFVEGVFKISQMATRLKQHAEAIGGDFGLVNIDTGPVFYEGDDESSRTQQGQHAVMLRNLVEQIPGRPTVIANVHPVNNAALDNLIPAGGGNFLNQVDGNLTAAKNDNTTELHWQGKFRGVEFAPMHFMLKTVTNERLKDSKSRLIPTVICEWISETAKENMDAGRLADDDKLLSLISKNPKSSLAQLATMMGWMLYSGEPNKMRAGRGTARLIKDKLISKTRAGYFEVTNDGSNVLSQRRTEKKT
jgi:hypothetical protein